MKINYTNWKGVSSKRNILPLIPFYGKNEWHPTEQWLLIAWDLEKQAFRTFAIKDMEF
jgi:predicted DNA-binding transcriptional regulator YafY